MVSYAAAWVPVPSSSMVMRDSIMRVRVLRMNMRTLNETLCRFAVRYECAIPSHTTVGDMN